MIKIICLGKMKEKYLRDAIDEYLKRIKKYAKIEIIELPDQNGDNKKVILELEKNIVLKNLRPKDYLITLELEGNEYTSQEFSNKLDQIFCINSNIVFLIGGSYGLHNEIKEKSNLAISFSKLTFPHQLFRVLLLEQIYRSFKIQNNETYHK